MSKLKDQVKKITFIEMLGLISSILTIITGITTLSIFKTMNGLTFDWVWAFMSQATMYACVFALYIAAIYFIYSQFNSFKEILGAYLYIFIIPIFLLITMFFVLGIGFIDMINFVGFE